MGYKAPRTYTITGSAATFNPVDATAYYFPMSASLVPNNTNSELRRFYIPITGVVRQCYVACFSAIATGTNEDWTINLYNGTTTTAIQTVGAATQFREWTNDNMNMPVTKGGYVQIRAAATTWVTNPEGCYFYWLMVVEYE